MATTYWVEQKGDSFWVHSSVRKGIYCASPDPQMKPPKDRAEQYIRACGAHGRQTAPEKDAVVSRS